MKDNRLESYKRWDKVADYESDCNTVTLLNDKGKAIAEFNYPGFTLRDFEFFKYGKVEIIDPPGPRMLKCTNPKGGDPIVIRWVSYE